MADPSLAAHTGACVEPTDRTGLDMPTNEDVARPRVLVVDDDEATRRVVERQLAGLAVDASSAAGGREALDRLAAEPFDLVLLDGMMPGMDGAATVREIRRREAAAPAAGS